MAYREVQDRHHDIQKIERTLEELAQLFNDVSKTFVFPYDIRTHPRRADVGIGRSAR